MTNPYSGYGRPVFGERLIGRDNELAKLGDNIVNSTASISIVGQRRIGKTSLITETKRRIQGSLPSGLALVFLDLSAFDDGLKFFHAVMEELEEYLHNAGIDSPSKFQRILDKKCNTSYEAYRRCRRGLTILKQENIHTKLIIDEFDAVRKLKEADQFIQWLRELIDKGFETGLSTIFLSRRSLFSIENQIVHVSNIDHVCEKLYIKPLNIKELNQLTDRAREEISISNGDQNRILEYTGGHPYLAELLLCHACEKGSVEQGIQYSTPELYDFYEHLRSLLEEDDLFGQLTQIVIGPRWKIRINSASILLNYGLITKKDDQTYSAWSSHFQAYLSKISREVPIWNQWGQTESLIRDFIEDCFSIAYGPDWLKKLESRKNIIPKIIDNCQKIMKKEVEKFGSNATHRWIEYTYPNDLWQIISLEWDKFSPVLQRENNKNKKYWAERFELLSKIRNPLAHNREQVISDHEITLANAYCSELCQVITHNKQCSELAQPDA